MSFDDQETTTEQLPVFVPEQPIVAEAIDETQLQIGALTHRGRVRTRNEDQYAVVRRSRSGVVLASSIADAALAASEEHAWLLAVADGLGGHASGEVASETAIRTVLNFANGLSSWIMLPSEGQHDEIARRVELYVQAIQKQLQKLAQRETGLAGMATTLTAAYVLGSSAVVINVGDSRTYLVRAQKIYQITLDHTLAQEMQDKGDPPEKTRPFSSVLTRCISTNDDPINVDLFHVDLMPDDQLLLCSDGLTDMLSDRAIEGILTSGSSVKEACEHLVLAALSHGGRDNVTVVLARV